MEFICSRPFSSGLFSVLGLRLRSTVLSLLAAFHPRSLGNLYHAASILQKLLEQLPGATLSIMASPAGRCLLRHLFSCAQEPPVGGLLVSLFSTSAPDAVWRQLQDFLAERRLTLGLAQALTTSQATASLSFVCKELLLMLLGEQTRHSAPCRSNLSSLLQGITEEGQFVPVLLQHLLEHTGAGTEGEVEGEGEGEGREEKGKGWQMGEDARWKAQYASEVLSLLVERSASEMLSVVDYSQMAPQELEPMEALPETHVFNPFYSLHDGMRGLLRAFLPVRYGWLLGVCVRVPNASLLLT